MMEMLRPLPAPSPWATAALLVDGPTLAVPPVHDPEASPDENDIVWRSNKDGSLGRGYVLRTDRLTVGEHEVT